MMNQALNPLENLEWCDYALFISDKECINKHYMVDSTLRHANLAVSLYGLLLALSSLATEEIQIQCSMGIYIQQITPPLTIISIEKGCEGLVLISIYLLNLN